jgi:dGTPase
MAKYDSQSHRPKAHLQILAELNRREQDFLLPYGTPSARGVRRRPEERADEGYRQAFSIDVDRILHARAYTRYIDKTQVFYLIRNDHITHRVLHVQLVSKIARTIGRFLGLNEDLIEAVALGHDIGHTPFGHDGERFLRRLCESHGIGSFHHNVQSVQFLDRVERKGKGWNLCLQTLDGILCHDGETHDRMLQPLKTGSFETLSARLHEKKQNLSPLLIPMTLEGCVVRMADTVSYIGRDIEDAIRLGMIQRSDLPRPCTDILGDTNGTMVYNLVTDIIENSYRQPFVAFSPDVSQALEALKRFNLERIYLHSGKKQYLDQIERMFVELFETCLADLVHEKPSALIYRKFLSGMSEDYTATHRKEEIVRDYIAGMTDHYFLRQFPEERRPRAREG